MLVSKNDDCEIQVEYQAGEMRLLLLYCVKDMALGFYIILLSTSLSRTVPGIQQVLNQIC